MSWSDWLGVFRGCEFPGFSRKRRRRRLRGSSQRERHRGAVQVETLEPRLLLAFQPATPWGSLIYQDRWGADFETPLETDSFSIELDADQTLAGLAFPGNAGTTCTRFRPTCTRWGRTIRGRTFWSCWRIR